MGKIVRNLKSFSGVLLTLCIALIVLFFALNFIQTKAPSPISGLAGWASSHASGDAYAPSAPAMNTSPASFNNNLGPAL